MVILFGLGPGLQAAMGTEDRSIMIEATASGIQASCSPCEVQPKDGARREANQ
jgi:hypothetical protein